MWPIFAFLAAFSWATADLFSKQLMNFQQKDEYITLFARFFFSLPVLWLCVVLTSPHNVHPEFWLVNLAVIPGDLVASMLYMKALKISPISIVVPLLSFAPVFMLATSAVILGEPPSLIGVFGVLLVTAGAYTLNLEFKEKGLLEPLKALFTQKGPFYTIAAAFIYSVDTALGKKALFYSDEFYFAFYYTLFMMFAYLPVVFLKSRTGFAQMLSNWRFWAVGLFYASGVVNFLLAIKFANIAYVSAIGKISIVIAVLYGRFFFGEKGLLEKLGAVFLMLIGIAFILHG